MNRSEFINNLRKSLVNIPAEDKEDIIYDYEEHFRLGVENGRTEEEIAKSLGEPRAIAKQYLANYTLEKAQESATAGNVFRAVFATVSLGFFNLIFVLGPFMGIVGVIIGFFAAALGITVAGIAVVIAIPLAPVLPEIIHVTPVVTGNPAAFIAAGAGLTCFGILFGIGVWYLTKYFYLITIRYLKLNIKLITHKEVL